jgi:hypothetical protein
MRTAAEKASGMPPWWQWYEPPTVRPHWLHNLLHRTVCTHCRGLRSYGRKMRRGEV